MIQAIFLHRSHRTALIVPIFDTAYAAGAALAPDRTNER